MIGNVIPVLSSTSLGDNKGTNIVALNVFPLRSSNSFFTFGAVIILADVEDNENHSHSLVVTIEPDDQPEKAYTIFSNKSLTNDNFKNASHSSTIISVNFQNVTIDHEGIYILKTKFDNKELNDCKLKFYLDTSNGK